MSHKKQNNDKVKTSMLGLHWCITFVMIGLATRIILAIMRMYGMETISWIGVLVDLIVGVSSSIALSIFIYYRYLKKIPETTEAKINDLLNQRLGYETTNHNAVLSMLEMKISPNTRDLSHNLSKEHDDLKRILDALYKQANEDKIIHEAAAKDMTTQQVRISQSVETLAIFEGVMESLVVKNQQLKEENKTISEQYKQLEDKLEQTQKQLEQLKKSPRNRDRER